MRVLIRGAGDIATGIALRLYRARIQVIMTDLPKPTAIRRTVCFSQAIVHGETEVESVRAVYAADVPAAEEIAAHQKEDTVEISRLFAQIPLCDGVDIGAVTAAFHAIYFATLERDKIAPEDYEKGLRLLIGGVLMQILA